MPGTHAGLTVLILQKRVQCPQPLGGSGAADDKTASRQQSYSKQSSDASSTLHGLLDNVIDK